MFPLSPQEYKSGDSSFGTGTSGTSLLGENIFTDDEEIPRSPHYPESARLLSTISGDLNSAGNSASASEASRNSKNSSRSSRNSRRDKNQYGSVQSPTSSLGFSDDNPIESDAYNKHARSMNRATIDALKDGGMLLTKEENRSLFSILLAVILTCTFSMAFLASSTPHANGSNDSHDHISVEKNDVSYFPFPGGSNSQGEEGIDPAMETANYVPFQAVDRKDTSIPASEIVFPELFHSSLRLPDNFTRNDPYEKIPSTEYPLPLLKVPFPSGAFWTNLVIKPTADRGLSFPIMSYPYTFKWNPSIMQVSYPPLRRLTDDISIRDIFNPDMTFGTQETITKRNIVSFDPLSVTVRFYGNIVNAHVEQHSTEPDPESSYWESYLVQGSPYITTKYNALTPVLEPLSIFQNFACPRDKKGDYKDDAADDSSATHDNSTDTKAYGVCLKVQVSECRKYTYSIALIWLI